MTPKERVMRVIKGEPVDRIPWFPRIDLWYNFHKRQNTLPFEYKDLTMEEIIKKIGGGIYNRAVPICKEKLKNTEIEVQYSNPIWKERIQSADRGLNRNYILALVLRSIFSSKSSVFVKFKKTVNLNDQELLVQFETPHGKVSTKFVSSEILQEAGIRPVQSEYFIKNINEDLEPFKYIIENIHTQPMYDDLLEMEEKIGEEGVVWARLSPYYSPMHQLMYVYMGLQRTCLELYDHPNKVEEILEFIEKSLQKVHKICLDSPAQFILHGGNFDSTVVGPNLFKKYFAPYFSNFAKKLHSKDKFLVVHVDGEMKNLMEVFTETNADVAEGFTPSPMTQVNFQDALKTWGNKVTIWGGIPAVILSKDTPEDDFCAYIKMLLNKGKVNPFVLSMGDNTPIDTDLKRLEKITEMVNKTSIK